MTLFDKIYEDYTKTRPSLPSVEAVKELREEKNYSVCYQSEGKRKYTKLIGAKKSQPFIRRSLAKPPHTS